jgi:hypothetical protein
MDLCSNTFTSSGSRLGELLSSVEGINNTKAGSRSGANFFSVLQIRFCCLSAERGARVLVFRIAHIHLSVMFAFKLPPGLGTGFAVDQSGYVPVSQSFVIAV